MNPSFLLDDPQAVARLDSVACLLEWTHAMTAADRTRFFGALQACSEEARQAVVTHLAIVKDPRATAADRRQAIQVITAALALGAEAEQAPADASQQAAFARRLRELMDAKRVSQQELAERIGSSQPAVSQMLTRQCRPQKRTILKLADALNVLPRDLWPDIEAADFLDAVAEFQQDDYPMSAAESAALADPANHNRPRVPVKALPAFPPPQDAEGV